MKKKSSGVRFLRIAHVLDSITPGMLVETHAFSAGGCGSVSRRRLCQHGLADADICSRRRYGHRANPSLYARRQPITYPQLLLCPWMLQADIIAEAVLEEFTVAGEAELPTDAGNLTMDAGQVKNPSGDTLSRCQQLLCRWLPRATRNIARTSTSTWLGNISLPSLHFCPALPICLRLTAQKPEERGNRTSTSLGQTFLSRSRRSRFSDDVRRGCECASARSVFRAKPAVGGVYVFEGDLPTHRGWEARDACGVQGEARHFAPRHVREKHQKIKTQA